MADETVLVDVGGGIGTLPELVLSVVPKLRFVVQDLDPVVKLANEVASPKLKGWIAEGRVEFRVQDFFTPQPADLQGAVFILKNVMSVSFFLLQQIVKVTSHCPVTTTLIQRPRKF